MCEKTISIDGDCPAEIVDCTNYKDMNGEPLNLICNSNTFLLEPQTNQLKHNCSCESVSEEVDDMKLNIEILQSRIDSLQSLANTLEVCKSVDVNYLNEIECLRL